MCARCGRIHERGKCLKAREYNNPSKQSAFRSTYQWTRTSKRIRERDNYLCQACLHNLDGQGVRYTNSDLEVHHIEALENNYDLRMDDDNLITLCRSHHEKAEQGGLNADQLKEIARGNAIIPAEISPPIFRGGKF